MSDSTSRWVLAFDGSCRTCREVSEVVAQACDGKLELLPLADADVRGWRHTALGADPKWAPTLLRVDGAGVRAWTNGSMSVPLVRRLGVRSTVAVVRALGQLRREAAGHASELPHGQQAGGITRKQLLRFGSGALVVGGLVLAGKVPAFASERQRGAQSWVQANKDKLPTSYAAVIGYPMEYRRAIFQASPPAVRSRLWVDHFAQYRAVHPSLSPAQSKVLAAASALAADVRLFGGAPDARVTALEEASTSAFGLAENHSLIGALGPNPRPDSPANDCDCEAGAGSPYCWGDPCEWYGCSYTSSGCGPLWLSQCTGNCYSG
jgi:hypothetical protein